MNVGNGVDTVEKPGWVSMKTPDRAYYPVERNDSS